MLASSVSSANASVVDNIKRLDTMLALIKSGRYNNFSIVDVPKNGGCLLYAIFEALESSDLSWDMFLDAIIAGARRNITYVPRDPNLPQSTDWKSIHDIEGNLGFKTMEEYVERIEQQRNASEDSSLRFLGEETLKIVSVVFHLNIILEDMFAKKRHPYSFRPPEVRRSIYLGYFTDLHYVLLVPDDELAAAQAQKSTAAVIQPSLSPKSTNAVIQQSMTPDVSAVDEEVQVQPLEERDAMIEYLVANNYVQLQRGTPRGCECWVLKERLGDDSRQFDSFLMNECGDALIKQNLGLVILRSFAMTDGLLVQPLFFGLDRRRCLGALLVYKSSDGIVRSFSETRGVLELTPLTEIPEGFHYRGETVIQREECSELLGRYLKQSFAQEPPSSRPSPRASSTTDRRLGKEPDYVSQISALNVKLRKSQSRARMLTSKLKDANKELKGAKKDLRDTKRDRDVYLKELNLLKEAKNVDEEVDGDGQESKQRQVSHLATPSTRDTTGRTNMAESVLIAQLAEVLQSRLPGSRLASHHHHKIESQHHGHHHSRRSPSSSSSRHSYSGRRSRSCSPSYSDSSGSSPERQRLSRSRYRSFHQAHHRDDKKPSKRGRSLSRSRSRSPKRKRR